MSLYPVSKHTVQYYDDADHTEEYLAIFKEFLAIGNDDHTDEEEYRFFLRGRSGTGKTTIIRKLVEIAIARDYSVVACAHTHKACDILRQNVPDGTLVSTLHSMLKKRPTINADATSTRNVELSVQHGDMDITPDLIIIDEYGVVAEEDQKLLEDAVLELNREIREEHPDSKLCRIVYAGDILQLEPVKAKCTIKPSGHFDVILRKQWRTTTDLGKVVAQLADFIEGITKPAPLVENDSFIRGVDLVEQYQQLEGSKFYLAYTNARVQEVNAEVEGKMLPDVGDSLYCPSLNTDFILEEVLDPFDVTYVDKRFGKDEEDRKCQLGDKYTPLEFIVDQGEYEFYHVTDGDKSFIFPFVFGTSNYLKHKQQLQRKAVETNNEIEKYLETAGINASPAQWAKSNYSDSMARKRSLAWRAYLTFNELVQSLDFNHARTVHKAQGSSVDNVCLDVKDLAKAKQFDFTLYMRLYYVGLGRARDKAYTN